MLRVVRTTGENNDLGHASDTSKNEGAYEFYKPLCAFFVC